jgi:hypothetical protein
MDELMGEQTRQLAMLHVINMQLPLTREYEDAQLLQMKGDEHCRQLGRDELHKEQLPLPKR